MSAPPLAPTVAAHPNPFPGYRAPEGCYDELCGADGAPRPHWVRLVDLLGSWAPAELVERWEQARRLIRDNGVTYNVHDEASGEQRPWVLDPIPLVVSADDWARLEVGINQRARVLDALLADLYGPQHVVREGLVPPELVYTSPSFLRCCHGMAPQGGRWLHLYGAVIVRNHDGKWLALGDRTGVPQGLGYALENRLVVSRLLPGVFHDCNVERLAPFFISLQSMLRGLAPGRETPRIALQSPGPTSRTYFEDAYLARYLGYTLVEGGDLAVRDDRVSLKTLGGLVPVDVLVRRVTDRECDPLELDGGALGGTPGLVQAVRRERVALANALGSRLVESPGFSEFLPAVARRLLGEDVVLPAPRSWWCGLPANLAHVLDRLDEVVVEPVHAPRGLKRYVPALLDATRRADLVSEIRARPAAWVGREMVERSAAPCWNGSGIVSASVLMRCFAVSTGDGYQSMRGGLARMSVGRSIGEELLLSSQGSKDVWVLSQGPVAPVSLLPTPGRKVALRRSGNDLPSRVADHLHWLGRHVERAETAARLLRAVATRIASESNQESVAAAAMLLGSLADPPHVHHAWLQPGRRETPREIALEIQSLVFDESRPMSVRASVRALWNMASVVRDRISIDSWKILSRVRSDCPATKPTTRRGGADVLSVLDTLILDLSAFAGLGTESMTRGPGWRFLDMGRRIERASAAMQVLGATLVPPRPPVPAADSAATAGARADVQRLWEMLLDIADSLMTYRNRYHGTLEAAPLIDLLVIDETNPRSIGFQVAALADHVARLPRDASSPVLSGEERAVMAATGLLRLADVDALAATDPDGGRPALGALLARLDTSLRDCSESVTHRYLVHAAPRRRLGQMLEPPLTAE
jgi:uncharacterized circularly permuted ATP-grasp superfamily protein/uncharacterized alpha-E superfamily protein